MCIVLLLASLLLWCVQQQVLYTQSSAAALRVVWVDLLTVQQALCVMSAVLLLFVQHVRLSSPCALLSYGDG
jgi:hypothetical protein